MAFYAFAGAASAYADEDTNVLSVLIHVCVRDADDHEHILQNMSLEDTFSPPTEKDWYIAPFKNPSRPFDPDDIEALADYMKRYAIPALSLEDKEGIGDAEVSRLAGLKELTWLDLDGTQVTDAGLLKLQKCRHLMAIGALGSDISEEGINRLEGRLGHSLRRINSAIPLEKKRKN